MIRWTALVLGYLLSTEHLDRSRLPVLWSAHQDPIVAHLFDAEPLRRHPRVDAAVEGEPLLTAQVVQLGPHVHVVREHVLETHILNGERTNWARAGKNKQQENTSQSRGDDAVGRAHATRKIAPQDGNSSQGTPPSNA